MQVFKTQHLKCCSFHASPQSEWLITAHLERIWSQHFGALGCHITSWLSTSKSPKRSSWNVAVLMPLPVKVAYHGSFREDMGSAFCDFGVSYRSLIRQMQVFKKGASEMLQFWCLSPVRVAYHGDWGEAWKLQHFKCCVLKTCKHLKCCSFHASPQSEWLITAHLERIWSQHFGPLGCHITSWLSTSKFPKRSSWNVAVLMPLPVRVVYHGSFRENLESAFCDFGVSYRSLIRQMQRFKKGTSEMLQFWCLSPVRVAYHGSFRENLESAFWGLGLSYHNLMKCMRVFEPV